VEVFEVGDLRDFETVYRFGKRVNMLTIEIEHVNVSALERLENEGTPVFPKPKTLRTIQDKRLQKQFYHDHAVPTSPFFTYESKAALLERPLKFPCVQKSASEGYDGKGVTILRSRDDLSSLPEGPGLIEDFVDGKREISVIVARQPSGQMHAYPAVEMEFHPTANLVEFLFSPSSLNDGLEEMAQQIARRVAEGLELVGLLAVEMFVTEQGEILVNESAPRPHNSGHHTIESNYTSQYEQHIRAILDFPLGSVRPRAAAVMVNLLGEPNETGYVEYRGIQEVLAMEGVYVHIYGKKQTMPFRKMGHVTIIADDLTTAKEKAIYVKNTLKVGACKTRK
jgi:5-(carboxyamino)imidazole ribonucleotide synthase